MKLSGLHLLLTYQCNLECDHCFVWGSPWQSGTLTLTQIRDILRQGKESGSVNSIYFEGGEPFLFYAILQQAVREAAEMGFRVGIVSNGYWATSVADAVEWLRPFVGLISDLSISNDLFHWSEKYDQLVQNARQAAEQLDLPVGTISIAQPEVAEAALAVGQLPTGESKIMYRGRAAANLVERATPHPWETFDTCPFENLRDPGRVHIDSYGNLHLCQGIVPGNLFETPLVEISETYDSDSHPITGPLLAGGPAELARRYEVPHADSYADACHLCFEVRQKLRGRFPELLKPDQMYGVASAVE